MSVHIPYITNNSKWFEYEQRWKEAALDLLNRCIPADKRPETSVLEYGCGRGEFLKLLRDDGYRCEGVDFDPECVRLSSQYSIAKLADEKSIDTLYDRKSFDVAVAIHVLEHVRNPADFVGKLSDIARSCLLLAVPNLQGTAYLSVRHKPYDANKGHVSGWDYSHFRNFLTNICELEIIGFAHDTVVLKTYISRIDRMLAKPAFSRFVHRMETGWLLRKFPYLSHSIIALCKISDV